MSALEWFVVIASARSNAVMPYIVMVWRRGRAVRKIIAKMRERTQGKGE
jgi:lipopolysaccharide biosynthesis protein